MKNCLHECIIIITETPKGEINGIEYTEISKVYVQCEECKQILPIKRITTEYRTIPLTKIYQ